MTVEVVGSLKLKVQTLLVSVPYSCMDTSSKTWLPHQGQFGLVGQAEVCCGGPGVLTPSESVQTQTRLLLCSCQLCVVAQPRPPVHALWCAEVFFSFSVICVFICIRKAVVCSVFSGERFLMPVWLLLFMSWLFNSFFQKKSPCALKFFFFFFLPFSLYPPLERHFSSESRIDRLLLFYVAILWVR